MTPRYRKLKSTQEAYEKIRAWLARPGAERCFNEEDWVCSYIEKDSLGKENRCAVGILLKQRTAKLLRNEGSVKWVIEGSPHADLFLSEVEGINLDFLEKAQRAHDGTLYDGTQSDWQKQALRDLDKAAREEGLDVVA